MSSYYKILILFFLFLSDVSVAQTDTKIRSPFKFNISYTADFVSNFTGGIKTGTMYLGLLNLKGEFSTETAKWWNDGLFFVNVANTHGGKPSEILVGDFQGVSNIEAGNLMFLYELWYKQSFGHLNIVAGLQDLNMQFLTNEKGALFNNSSFGINSSIADNIPTPIFPLTALGVLAQYQISKSIVYQAAIFDGTPDDFESNPYNIKWKLNQQQGFLAITELQIFKSLIVDKSGVYKLGAYYHQHNDSIDKEQKNGGLYFVGSQELINNLFAFSQIGISPKNGNKLNQYYSLGLEVNGLFRKRPNDQLGIAAACSVISQNEVRVETTIELTFKFQMNKNIFLRPDLQYIINPAGTNIKLQNSLVGFIRLGIDI
jgi:porin